MAYLVGERTEGSVIGVYFETDAVDTEDFETGLIGIRAGRTFHQQPIAGESPIVADSEKSEN